MQVTYDLLTGQKRLVNDAWQVIDDGGAVLADNVVWRANPGAILMWPRQEQAPKSGYWREFFYKLQEESLEKDLAKEQKEQPRQATKQAPKKSKKAPVRAKAVEYTLQEAPKPRRSTVALARARIVDTPLDARPVIKAVLDNVFRDLASFQNVTAGAQAHAAEDDDEELAAIFLLLEI